jgi:hypothetical protein
MKVLQIPLELCEMDLTISEIGAIAVLTSFGNIHWGMQKLWQSDRTFKKAIDNLVNDGILSQEKDGTISINLPSTEQNNHYENKQTKHEEEPQMVAEQGSKKTHESVFCEDDSTT